ncbi:T9SS type A sorting domain-containing protein [bacterium]|nr:T9SS type A sorting domain-containing protein [bacterium]
MQRVDIVSGQPQWENQGINITPTYLENSDSSNTRIYGPISIVPDGSGGAIAMWRMKTMGAQRMNEDGSLEWGENGISIFGQNFDFNTSRNHQLYSDNEGGAVVIAELGRSNDLGNQIKIQHLDSNGQTLHGETGILIQEIDNDRYSLRMRSTQLSDGNFLISWMRNFNLEAIKVNMDGENLWNSTVALHEFGERYSSYKVAEIENTITITYEDIEGETYQTYIMYLNQEGEKVQNQNDLRINNFDDNYQLVNLFSDGNSGWMTYLTGSELYLTSLNIEGDEPQLDADRAQLITNTASERVNVSIVADGVGGVFVFWGERGNGSDIHYKHFNNNIQPVCKEYQNGGVVLVDARYSQSQMCIVPDGEGGVLTAWNDWRASTGKQEGDDVYIMRVGDGYSLSSDDYAANVTLPDRWSLDAAYPNPFNSTTKISFKTPVKASIKVAVFDVMGREIARLAQGDHAAGKYSLIWDSRNSSGQSVVSGMYFYKLEGEGVQLTKKMFLIK